MSNETQLTVTQPTDLIQQAIEKGLGVEELGKLLDLQERWEANQARKSFFQSFGKFQSQCPELRKTKGVNFETSQGGNVDYKYAPLADIVRQIGKTIRDNDLSYRWEIQDNATEIKVTCLVSHVDGHTEKTTMTASPDTSGKKNAIQARGSAIEYLKRYTLIGALGLTTADSDIDGRMGEYDTDIDKLHATFMETYNQVIALDSNLNKWNPDNWLVERTGKNYIKAIGEIRKVLFDLQKKK